MPALTASERFQGVEMNNEVDISINDLSLADLFKNYTVALNETVYNAMYLADDGFGAQLVTGMSPTVSLTGDFNPDDPACAFFEGIQYKIGADRIATLKLNRGNIDITVPVTVTSVAIAGGDAGQPNSISVTLAFNGKPTIASGGGGNGN